jgi:hypothetical protein
VYGKTVKNVNCFGRELFKCNSGNNKDARTNNSNSSDVSSDKSVSLKSMIIDEDDTPFTIHEILRNKVTKDDFKMKSVIGKGSSGKVLLV